VQDPDPKLLSFDPDSSNSCIWSGSTIFDGCLCNPGTEEKV